MKLPKPPQWRNPDEPFAADALLPLPLVGKSPTFN